MQAKGEDDTALAPKACLGLGHAQCQAIKELLTNEADTSLCHAARTKARKAIPETLDSAKLVLRYRLGSR